MANNFPIDACVQINDDSIIHNITEVLYRSRHLQGIINVSDTPEAAVQNIKFAEAYSNMFCTIGVSSNTVNKRRGFAYDTFNQLEYIYDKYYNKCKIVAIGETGVDFKKKDTADLQKDIFIKHIELANKLHLPMIIKANKSEGYIIHLFKTQIKPEYGCVFHFLSGKVSEKNLRFLTNNGAYIAFSPKATTNQEYANLFATVDKEKFILESGFPFIRTARDNNERLYNVSSPIDAIFETVAALSEASGISQQEIISMSNDNVRKLF